MKKIIGKRKNDIVLDNKLLRISIILSLRHTGEKIIQLHILCPTRIRIYSDSKIIGPPYKEASTKFNVTARRKHQWICHCTKRLLITRYYTSSIIRYVKSSL